MRLTYIAAVLSALAACGGGDGLSLIEPGQVPICETATGAFTYPGVWQVEEWGCNGRPAQGGPIDCDPSLLTWTSTPEIVVTQTGTDTYRMVIDGVTIDAEFDGVSVGGHVDDATLFFLTGCADGSAHVSVTYFPTGDNFAAYAHRR